MMGIDKFNSQRVFDRNPKVSEFKIEVDKAIKKNPTTTTKTNLQARKIENVSFIFLYKILPCRLFRPMKL